MNSRSTIPPPSAGYAVRAAGRDDLQAVFELIAACQQHDVGEVHVEIADIDADWQHPELDLPNDGIIVLDDAESVVAYGEVFAGRAEAYVLPAHRGHGIGTWLARRITDRACTQNARFVRQCVRADNEPAREVLERAGYEQSDTAWALEIDLGAPAASRPLPADVELRDFVPGADEAVWRLVEDAFGEWPNRVPNPFEGWRAQTIMRAGFEPWMLPLLARGGELVGAAYCIDIPASNEGWVQQLAVRVDQRRRGCGAVLLHEAFRRFATRGRTKVGLSTDSRTGALALYERVGMHVSHEYVGLVLRTGADGDG